MKCSDKLPRLLRVPFAALALTALLLDGSLAVVALPVEAPRLHFSLAPSNYLVFNWTNSAVSFRLQSQTNALDSGLGVHWHDYTGGTHPPILVPLEPASGSVFYRLSAP